MSLVLIAQKKMTDWILSAIGRPRAEYVIAENTKLIAELQDLHDDQAAMAQQCHNNAVRLASAKNMPAARQALAQKKDIEVQLTLTAGKIATLHSQTAQLRGMDTNVKMHQGIQQVNRVADRMAGKMNVDKVNEDMDKALEHKDSHRDISEALAGRDLLEPADPDELDDELRSLLGEAKESGELQKITGPSETELKQMLLDEARAMEQLDRMPPAPIGKSTPTIAEMNATLKK